MGRILESTLSPVERTQHHEMKNPSIEQLRVKTPYAGLAALDKLKPVYLKRWKNRVCVLSIAKIYKISKLKAWLIVTILSFRLDDLYRYCISTLTRAEDIFPILKEAGASIPQEVRDAAKRQFHES